MPRHHAKTGFEVCRRTVTQSALAPAETIPARSRRTLARPVLAALLAAAGVFGIDALLFRTHWYASVIEPESSAGQFELTLRRELRAQDNFGGNAVTGVGNSRFNYYPRIANQLMVETGLVFRSARVDGSTPQSWYYLLRDLDPAARRYRAILIGVDDYDERDGLEAPDSDLTSLHYAIFRLRLGDTLEFARGFQGFDLQWRAFRGALLKGIVLQPDILAFLAHPRKRIADVREIHRGFDEWSYNYLEPESSMAGLRIDWSSFTATFPPGFTPLQRQTVIDNVAYPPRPSRFPGDLAAYRRTWFGRIIDRYRGSRTKIIFVRLPRAPIPRPDGLDRITSSSIRELAHRPNVLLCPEHAFDSLERPEFFKDGLHLNLEGSTRFSEMLAREVASLLRK